MSGAPTRAIVQAGAWAAARRADVDRRRDELLKTDRPVTQPPPARQGGASGAVGRLWDDYVHHYLPGLWDGTKELGLAGLAGNPTTAPVYLAIDPKGWMEHGPIGQIKGLFTGAQHPLEFAKAVANWDEWQHDPIRAFGHAIPGIVLAAATGGAGAGSGAGSRIAATAPRLGRRGKTETPHAVPRGPETAKPGIDPHGLETSKPAPPPPKTTPPKPATPPAPSGPPHSPDVKVAGPGKGPLPRDGDQKVAGPRKQSGPDGDVKVGGKDQPPSKAPTRTEPPAFTREELDEIIRSGRPLREVLESRGPEGAGQVIGREAEGLGRGARKQHIIDRIRGLHLTQANAVKAVMSASKQAFKGVGGSQPLPDGDVAVLPTQPQVKDTFVVHKDGTVTARKTEREIVNGKLKIIFLD